MSSSFYCLGARKACPIQNGESFGVPLANAFHRFAGGLLVSSTAPLLLPCGPVWVVVHCMKFAAVILLGAGKIETWELALMRSPVCSVPLLVHFFCLSNGFGLLDAVQFFAAGFCLSVELIGNFTALLAWQGTPDGT